MTDRDTLHAAVLLQPAEDVPRLAYADCLQEDGDDELAEFIRARVTAAKYRDETVILAGALRVHHLGQQPRILGGGVAQGAVGFLRERVGRIAVGEREGV